jgi:GTP-binding protein
MNFHLVEFERSFGLSEQLPAGGEPEFVFAGRSNVGKSSLINRLFNRKNLARVSATPGKTATINFYRCGPARFVDLPGYGYAKVAKSEKRRFGDLVGGYFAQDRLTALVFVLLDMRHAPSADDLRLVDYLIDSQTPLAAVLTKADKLSDAQQAERLEAFSRELPCGEEITKIAFSSETGQGVEQLRRVIEEFFEE